MRPTKTTRISAGKTPATTTRASRPPRATGRRCSKARPSAASSSTAPSASSGYPLRTQADDGTGDRVGAASAALRDLKQLLEPDGEGLGQLAYLAAGEDDAGHEGAAVDRGVADRGG